MVKMNFEAKQSEQAIEEYSKAIELDPKRSEAFHNRGLAYGNLGNYQRAIEDFGTAIEISPEWAEAYYDRGVAYHIIGDSRRWAKDYEKAKKLNPKYASIYYDRDVANPDLAGKLEPNLDGNNNFGGKNEIEIVRGGGFMKWIIVIALSVIALSWGIWTAIGVFILGYIIICILASD